MRAANPPPLGNWENTLRKVVVGITIVLCQFLPDAWQHLIEIKLVGLTQAGQCGLRELENANLSAFGTHASHFSESTAGVLDVSQTKGNGDSLKPARTER